MKVLHLLQSNRFSGAENVVCQIIGMMKNEPDIEMVYCSSDGQIREALAERNIRFIPLKRFSIVEIIQVLKNEKPDIIHAHDMRASFYATCACSGIPIISHIHNNAFDSRGLSIKSVAYMLAAMKARHIFWVSQSAFEGYMFKNVFRKKSSVLCNIIDVDALYEKKCLDDMEYDYDVAYVGRLSYPKNPQRLMSVFRLVLEKMPNIKIAVIGTGELEEEIKALAKEYKLNNNVEFLGFQSNPLKMLSDSKVMVMTSRWEGTPMCVLEAMALGVPIVSTPVDGLKDLIINGKNGYLFDGDDKLAEKICEIVENKELHDALGAASKEMICKSQNKETYKEEILSKYRQ